MTDVRDLTLPSGRVRVERSGDPAAPAAVCVHGLSANLRSWDRLREPLVDAGRQMVALDLRGRGRSEDSGPGTYGLDTHARDVLAVADELGLAEFDYVGWSMGALIGLEVAASAGARLRTATLIDAVGGMDPAAIETVRAGTARLDALVPDSRTYVEIVRKAGVFEPWDDFWDAYFSYELEEVDGGVSPSTSRAACLEDLEQSVRDFVPLWDGLTMSTLLVWASEPLGGGLVVPVDVRDAFLQAVRGSALHSVDRNHYGVMLAPGVPEAIVGHISSQGSNQQSTRR